MVILGAIIESYTGARRQTWASILGFHQGPRQRNAASRGWIDDRKCHPPPTIKTPCNQQARKASGRGMMDPKLVNQVFPVKFLDVEARA